MPPLVGAMAGGTLLILVCATAGALALGVRPTRRLLLAVMPATWRRAWDQSFELYGQGKMAVGGGLLLSLASNGMTLASFAAAGSVLGEAVAPGAALLAGTLVVLANCLPISPGGIGVAEAAAEALFAAFGVRGGAEMMVLVRLSLALLALPGGLAALTLSRRSWPSPCSLPEAPADE
jgi:uncharacterized membrane protein YbhN (UPF0104 family)